MATSAPAWATDELAEEWVSDGEAPASPVAVARSLHGSVRIDIPQDTSITECRSAAPSPSGSPSSPQGGTFLLRDDQPFPETPLGIKPGDFPKKGVIKDFFSPLAIETMFEPPSPPPPTPSALRRSTTPPIPPPNPTSGSTKALPPRSKLSQSHVPPSEPSEVDGDSIEDSILDDTQEDEEEEEEQDPDEIVSTDIPGLTEFDGRKPSSTFKFTFKFPRTPLQANESKHCSPPNPTPNPRALQTPERGWVHGRTSSENADTDTRLKLFQFKYDTFTREHLGALADSIAVKGSPSDGQSSEGPERLPSPPPKRLKVNHPDDDISGSPLSSQDSSNSPWAIARSRKYSRASPSLARMLPGVGRLPSKGSEEPISVMVDGMFADTLPRDAQYRVPSGSSTATVSTAQTPRDGEMPAIPAKRNTVNYRLQGANILARIKNDVLNGGGQAPESGESDMSGSQAVSQTDESILSSSTASEDPSRAAATRPSGNPPRKLLRRPPAADELEKELVATSPNASFDGISPIEDDMQRNKVKSFTHVHANKVVIQEPTIVFNARISTNTPALSSEITSSVSSAPTIVPPSNSLSTASGRRVPSTAPTSLHPNHAPATHADMNRFVSSSTMTSSALSGTTAGSFVKHPGPPVSAQMRTIHPDEVKGVLPQQVGGMVFSTEKQMWIKQLDTSADLSDDPFADLTSTPRSLRHSLPEVLEETEPEEGQSSRDEQAVAPNEAADEEADFSDLWENESFHPPIPANATVIRDGRTSSNDNTVEFVDVSDPPIPDPVIEAPMVRAKSMEELSEGIANMSLQIDLSPVKPAARSRTGSLNDARTPGSATKVQPPPRSALKATPRYTPAPEELSPTSAYANRRSVSFSDGRKNGKMRDIPQDLDSTTSSTTATETGDSTDRSKDELHTVDNRPPSSYVPSTRTKRIHNMLEGLDDSGGFTNTFATRSHQVQDREQRAASPTQSSSNMNGNQVHREPTPEPEAHATSSQSRRIFSRTKTRLPGEATFTTELSVQVMHEQLIRALTSVEPYEPYWEELRGIDLREKGLESLNRLNELMPSLDRLRVDGNSLCYLSGVPGGLRGLLAAGNSLSSLTSYTHLPNLEELDISNNQIESLEQLECLKHLRELRADGNRISKLDGLSRLERLTKVSLKGNALSDVIDLESVSWPRLENLDLSDNQVRVVQGLGSLQGLVNLNLDNNALETLAADETMMKLRGIRLSGNRISVLDCSAFPGLRTLYADENRLERLENAGRLTKLENLSLRSQVGGKLSLSSRDVRDVKRLYLSGNPLNEREFFSEPCYNLLYLELAACRLSVLPANFAAMVPNVRVLNLNYNFLTDLAKPLTGLSRLRKLMVIGSRLKASKPIIKMLLKMPEVELLDFRMNPFSLGWYLPVFVSETNGLEAGGAPETIGAGKKSRGASSAGSLDDRFRRDLPDEVYVARMGFRGLVMRACPKTVSLDGVVVTDAEREKTGKLLVSLEKSRAAVGGKVAPGR